MTEVNLAYLIKSAADELAESKSKASKSAMLYDERRGGFSCGSCEYYHQRSCDIVEGDISPSQGCCAAWKERTSRSEVEELM